MNFKSYEKQAVLRLLSWMSIIDGDVSTKEDRLQIFIQKLGINNKDIIASKSMSDSKARSIAKGLRSEQKRLVSALLANMMFVDGVDSSCETIALETVCSKCDFPVLNKFEAHTVLAEYSHSAIHELNNINMELCGKKNAPIAQKTTKKSEQVNNTIVNRVFENEQKMQIGIVDVAANLNMAYNMGSPLQAEPLCRELYSMVGPRRLGGKALLQLANEDCQCVGLAFVTMALRYNWGDVDINSVAAENAFYCLVRNLTTIGNTYVAPAIFSILYEAPQLLREKLISSKCTLLEKQVGAPIGLILGMRNPYRDPTLEEFRQEAIKNKDSIMYYVLSQFYNIEQGKYKIQTDLPYFIPTEQSVASFLSRVEFKERKEQFFEEGKMHLISVYKECEKTLTKF